MKKSLPLLAVVLLLVVCPAAQAQIGGYYAPRGGFYAGVFVGPYFGYFPGQINGFWTNGYSLYGPPVPTYGSVPGVFGGADQRLDLFPERFPYYDPYWYGFGWRGTVIPLNQKPLAPVPSPIPGMSPIGAAEVEVELPAPDAMLTFQGQPTKQTGTHRWFRTPPLAGPGRYSVHIAWNDNGQDRVASRSVVVKPGDRVLVDFTKEEEVQPGQPLPFPRLIKPEVPRPIRPDTNPPDRSPTSVPDKTISG